MCAFPACGQGHNPCPDRAAHLEALPGIASHDDVLTLIQIDHLVHDLRFVEQGLHGSDADECTDLDHVTHRTLEDLEVLDGEDDGLEADLLVHCAIAVDDATASDGLMMGGEDDEPIHLVELALKRESCEPVDVIV